MVRKHFDLIHGVLLCWQFLKLSQNQEILRHSYTKALFWAGLIKCKSKIFLNFKVWRPFFNLATPCLRTTDLGTLAQSYKTFRRLFRRLLDLNGNLKKRLKVL